MLGLMAFFPDNHLYAVIISLVLNILVAIAGVIPSAFITAGNVTYFGFQQGLVISILGEAMGAVISFYLYRKGIKGIQSNLKINLDKSKLLSKLQDTKGMSAFFLVLILRILPFVPSGLVTFTAAMSTMSVTLFAIASTLGKVPALYIEALSIYSVINWEREFQWAAIAIASTFFLLYLILQRRKKKGTET
ncbi:TVP38/TMEM64 family protein [Cytobacillus sp. FJAT-54145]|uniref:TVP38/TMEM64 family membrane protein n=1 Tax=Cytobacillus spartinae TaxID=3299023 RepID=A0ABW6KJ44_9BACI